MKKPLMRLIVILFTLTAASLACNLPANGSNPTPTMAPVQSTDDLQQLEDDLQATLENPGQNSEVSITITQQQLNSFIAAKLAEQSDPVIKNPQVVLTNGVMEVYGQVNQSGITADTKIVLTPSVDAEGNPNLDILSFEVGPFSAPDALNDRVETMIDNLVAGYIASTEGKFTLISITIGEGTMTVTGLRNQP